MCELSLIISSVPTPKVVELTDVKVVAEPFAPKASVSFKVKKDLLEPPAVITLSW